MKETEATYIDQLTEQTIENVNGGMGFFGNFPELWSVDFEMNRLSEIGFGIVPEFVEYFDLSNFILKERLIEFLYQMKQLAKKQISAFSQYEQNLHSFFTILYGMISSHLSFIFSAFTGSSLARILS
jgi:hypothetical protein